MAVEQVGPQIVYKCTGCIHYVQQYRTGDSLVEVFDWCCDVSGSNMRINPKLAGHTPHTCPFLPHNQDPQS